MIEKMAHPRGFEPLASAFGGQPEGRSERVDRLISAAFGAERRVNLRGLLGLSELSDAEGGR